MGAGWTRHCRALAMGNGGAGARREASGVAERLGAAERGYPRDLSRAASVVREVADVRGVPGGRTTRWGRPDGRCLILISRTCSRRSTTTRPSRPTGRLVDARHGALYGLRA